MSEGETEGLVGPVILDLGAPTAAAPPRFMIRAINDDRLEVWHDFGADTTITVDGRVLWVRTDTWTVVAERPGCRNWVVQWAEW